MSRQRRIEQSAYARLAAVGPYSDLITAFEALLAHHEGDMEELYTTVRDLASLDP